MSRPTTTGKVLEHYLEAHASCDLETVVDLFCDDAVLEDPAGSEPHVGRASIRAFFAASHRENGRLAVERLSPVIGAGAEAALHIRAATETADYAFSVDVIYLVSLADDGRIASLRAFFEMPLA